MMDRNPIVVGRVIPQAPMGPNVTWNPKPIKHDLFVVGRIYNNENKNEIGGWEFIGLFDNYPKALSQCATRKHFIGPVRLNEAIVGKPQPWPGIHYPRSN